MSKIKSKRKEALEHLMQEEIYEAAIELLLEKSMEDITMAEISLKTGVSRPTLYRYVNGKEGLIEFVGTRIGLSLIGKLQEVIALNIEPIEKLKLFLTHFLTTFHKKEKILSILMRAGEPCGNSQEELEMHKLFDESMAKILLEIRQEKIQSEEETFLQVQMIYGTLSGLIEKAAVSKIELDIPKVTNYLMKLFLNGLNY